MMRRVPGACLSQRLPLQKAHTTLSSCLRVHADVASVLGTGRTLSIVQLDEARELNGSALAVQQLVLPSQPEAHAWSPDGRFLVVGLGGTSRCLCILDVG